MMNRSSFAGMLTGALLVSVLPGGLQAQCNQLNNFVAGTQRTANTCWVADGLMVLGWFKINVSYDDFWMAGNQKVDSPISCGALVNLLIGYGVNGSCVPALYFLDIVTDVNNSVPAVANIRKTSDGIGHGLVAFGYRVADTTVYYVNPTYGGDADPYTKFITLKGTGTFAWAARVSQYHESCLWSCGAGKRLANPLSP